MDDPSSDNPESPITSDDLQACGMTPGRAFGVALREAPIAQAMLGRERTLAEIRAVVADPTAPAGHPHFADVAALLTAAIEQPPATFTERDEPAPWASWCDAPEEGALQQMNNAMRIPSAVRGALMPDAHRGYGLPIGGVLATEGTVIPYAVGVDIACRMKLTVLDLDPETIETDPRRLEQALLKRTQFGVGSKLAVRDRPDHDVLDPDKWEFSRLTHGLRDKAWEQLGTSGSGNHFVEFGKLTLDEPDLGLAPGTYLAVMSHSGSRGPGAQIASFYSKRARELHPELPKELSHLAWLDLDSDDGRAYWQSMELMGEFASASHAVIHERVRDFLGAQVLASVENHHNYAWLEEHDGKQLVVHRKGATPAGDGVLGVIPGSMATPAFIVRGRGSSKSLLSASHGAGRVMSRTAAKQQFTWKQVKPRLDAAGVRLLAAGIDENPFVYKDINEVMGQQQDLVKVVARFDPRIVRMADAGERPED